MRRILFITTKSQNGGAQKWTKEQIEICHGVFDCYLATDEDGWLSRNSMVNDKLLNKLIHKRLSFEYLHELSRFVKHNKVDMIIASSANAGIYARLVKLLNRDVKIIYVSHGWSSIYNGGILKFLYVFIERQLSKITDYIVCISKKDFHNAIDIIGIRNNKLKLISNSIYPISNNGAINKSDKLKLLTVARLTPPKRVDLLISAMKNIDAELHIVGDGEMLQSLKEISYKNIFFHGEVDGFSSFGEYDLFCLISDSEGLPLSALEAMSAGLPLVLSNVGGCSELVQGNGVLVDNTVEDIERAIQICTDNYKQFSKNSKILFENTFDLNKNIDTYLNFYKKALS